MLLVLILLLVCVSITLCHDGYDSSNVQFHPSGRILLTEYAKEVVSRGGPVAAIKLEDGIILAAARQKPRSILQESGSKKVFFIDKHISIAASGSIQSLEPVVRLARNISLQYKSVFDAPIPVEKMCDSLASALHSTTISAYARRPIPVGLIVAGVDSTLGCQIYSVDPEGSVHGWNAVAIGKMSDDIMKSLATFGGYSTASKLSIKTAWPLFRNRMLAIIRKNRGSIPPPVSSEIGLTDDQKDFKSEYVQHHSEVSDASTDEWDIEV